MWDNITKISAVLSVLHENNANTYTICLLLSLLVCAIGLFAVFYYVGHLEDSNVQAGSELIPIEIYYCTKNVLQKYAT